jgi:CheY-like chemotaxis protein
MTPQHAETDGTRASAKLDGRRGVLLVVDDNFDIREALKDLLTNEGYSVACAVDGTDALRLLRGGLQPQAILLDIMMRGMNGDLFRKAQQEDPGLAAIPVIVLSGNRQAVDQAVAEGAAGALHKPFRFEALRQALEACIHAEESLRPQA